MTCLGLVLWGAVLMVAVLGIATGAVLYLWSQGYTVTNECERTTGNGDYQLSAGGHHVGRYNR